jgi:hypothetical protein
LRQQHHQLDSKPHFERDEMANGKLVGLIIPADLRSFWI